MPRLPLPRRTPQRPCLGAPAAPQQSPPPTIAQQVQAAAKPQPVTYPGPFSRRTAAFTQSPRAVYAQYCAAELNLQNSQRLYDLIQDGKLRISLRDAIALALENNLTLASFRYNFPIARADLLRTKAGGNANGVNTSVVSTTASGFGASGAAVAPQPRVRPQATAASSLPRSAPARAFPRSTPILIFSGYVQHTVTPEPNLSQVGVELFKVNNIEVQSAVPTILSARHLPPGQLHGLPSRQQQPLLRSQSRTEFQFHGLFCSSRCCTDSALPATSASSTLPKETCRPPISPFSSRSLPPSPTSRTSIGIW